MAEEVCAKCKLFKGQLIKVRRDWYCEKCFNYYVRSKYRKAVDAWRLEIPAGEKKIKILLALSGGISSSVLYEMAYSSVMTTRGKYLMPIALHIDDSVYDGKDYQDRAERIQWLRREYPDMQLVTRTLDDVDQMATSDLQITPHHAAETAATQAPSSKKLQSAIASLSSSRTSQEDMVTVYRDRLILKTATDLDCGAVLFGDSATGLAAKTLALTAKGRGYALPWTVADHCLSESGIWSVRPLKQILHSELVDYASLLGLPASSASSERSGRASSIDDLTSRYFAGLEHQFPSLVATVVRTTSKLVPPVHRSEALGTCTLCSSSFTVDAKTWLRNITVNEPGPALRSHLTESSGGSEEGTTTTTTTTTGQASAQALCYGCEVALRGTKRVTEWPIMDDAGRNHDAKTLLDTYELDE